MKQLLFASLFFCVSACGFQPVYAPQNLEAGPISIDPIEGREGHELRQKLIRRLSSGLPNVSDSAVLSIELDQRLRRLAFQPDQSASRTDVVATADYVLSAGPQTISGKISAETSYNVPDEPFADISAQVDATDRVTTLLAQKLLADMRLKLAEKPVDPES